MVKMMCEDWRGQMSKFDLCLCCGSPDKCRWVRQDLVNDICKVRMLKDLHYITSADPQVYTIVSGCSLAAPAPGCCWTSQRSGVPQCLFQHPWLTLPKYTLKQSYASTSCRCDKQLTQPSQIDTGKSLSYEIIFRRHPYIQNACP